MVTGHSTIKIFLQTHVTLCEYLVFRHECERACVSLRACVLALRIISTYKTLRFINTLLIYLLLQDPSAEGQDCGLLHAANTAQST